MPFREVVRGQVITAELTGKKTYAELALQGYTGFLNAVYDALDELSNLRRSPLALLRTSAPLS